MTDSSSTGPRSIYLDTCVVSAAVKGELSSGDSAAVGAIGGLVQSSDLTVCTSTVMKEELSKIPDPFRKQHLDAYDGLRIVAGHPTTSWIDDDPESATYGSQTEHPLFAELKQIVPDVNDARHLYQAKMNDVSDFVTIDEKTILSRATEIRNRT